MADGGSQAFPVLITGGGLVGLSMAMFLAQHGVPSLAIENLRGGSPLPRAAHFHMRTLELFRLAGIEAEVQRTVGEGVPARRRHRRDGQPRRQKARRHHRSLNAGVEAVSPCRRLFITQPGLEPILRRRARTGRRAGDRRPRTMRRRRSGRATAYCRRQGRRQRRGADPAGEYLVGADGAHSKVRELLDIPFDGRGVFSNSITIYFHCRSVAPDGRQADQRHLHQQPGVRRLLPPRQGLPVRDFWSSTRSATRRSKPEARNAAAEDAARQS